MFPMCFVLGRILGTFASSSAPELSSNMVQHTVGFTEIVLSNCLRISSTSRMSGMTSLRRCERLTYSDSVVDNVTSVCIFEAQKIGGGGYKKLFLVH